MDTDAQKKFLEIQNLFVRMSHEEVCPLIESYYIWRTLIFARSIPEKGQEQADKNAKLMSLYKEFFTCTEQSHLQTFVIGAMKFFDKDHRTLSIGNLIKKLKENENILTPNLYRSMYPHFEQIGIATDDYTPIKQEDIDHFENIRIKHQGLISSLKDLRDKQLAHTDMETIKVSFIPNEVEELISDIQDMFNKLSNSFDRSSTIWDHLERDCIHSTEFVLENLERGEKVRLEEIHEKWRSYE